MYAAQIWRELFSRPSLEQALENIAPILRAELGIGAVVLRRIDVERGRVTTVAQESVEAALGLPSVRRDCTGEELAELLGWIRSGSVLRGRPERDPVLTALVGRLDSELVAVPLLDGEGPLGALLLVAAVASTSERHADEAARLQEPFCVALANTLRFQELARLREVVEADNRALLSKLDRQEIMGTMIGADAGFRSVVERLEQVAPTDAPVLLLGETGTGKEVVARTIHSRSRRRLGPMLRVNCGAIPPGLIDSELFGHERGSFTGAVAARTGWFERADGGTLFLDEIGELPLAAQVRLLRVLQEGVLERVGGQRPVSVDVRIVAATNRDLESMVREGTFREDLFYRVSVFPIPLPPLRDRRQDIPALAAHFAWHAGKRIGGSPLAPAPGDVELLLSYDWPGNVRELAAVIERAAILGDGRRLDIAGALGSRRPRTEPQELGDVDARPSGARVVIERTEKNGNGSPGGPHASLMTLDQAIALHIERALSTARGRIEGRNGAAELLGVNPYTLRSKMRRLGIRWQRFREQS